MNAPLQGLIRQLRPALIVLVLLSVLTGVAYPLAVTGVAKVAFGHKADGSLIRRHGVVVGSSLIGQPFIAPKYLHPRPSAAGAGYDGTASSGSNLGPSSQLLLDAVKQRVGAYRSENRLSDDVLVPVDAVTASGSGLDPDISLANARLQAPRVANARGVALAIVQTAIDRHTSGRPLGILGDPVVNVLLVNLDLDAAKV